MTSASGRSHPHPHLVFWVLQELPLGVLKQKGALQPSQGRRFWVTAQQVFPAEPLNAFSRGPPRRTLSGQKQPVQDQG